MRRLTYKSSMGDYGSAVDWEEQWQEIYALRNKVGKYEDTRQYPRTSPWGCNNRVVTLGE